MRCCCPVVSHKAFRGLTGKHGRGLRPLSFAALKASNGRLMESLNAIYAKIEGAYISYKKFHATPGHKEYGNMMKSALEDGIQEADSAVAKFRTMSREK